MEISQSARSLALIERADLQQLLEALQNRGYQTIGPVARDGAIVYDTLASIEDLPAGWTDEQEPGRYRLKRREDRKLFGYVVGPHSWKRFLHPSAIRLWQAKRDADGLRLIPNAEPAPRYAFLGVRACELRAIAVQDRVFLSRKFQEPIYAQRRANTFIVAINCGQAGGTCFCVSMHSGPQAKEGFDLALTEVLEGSRHYFVTEIGSPQGAEVLAQIPHREATPDEQAAAEREIANANAQMGRTMEADGLQALLRRNIEHPQWDKVAERCLNCGNCTMVCPTCFCTTVEDTTDLTGETAERWRHWDSCFTLDFSYIHGGNARSNPAARYRQWITHKLGTWHDQFGESGCVGCGRCITWCPVGIDITEEIAALRRSESASKERTDGES